MSRGRRRVERRTRGCVAAEGEFGRGETERETRDADAEGWKEGEGGRRGRENSPLADYVAQPASLIHPRDVFSSSLPFLPQPPMILPASHRPLACISSLSLHPSSFFLPSSSRFQDADECDRCCDVIRWTLFKTVLSFGKRRVIFKKMLFSLYRVSQS